MEKVYVIMPDYGCEGLREPIIAFHTEAAAKRWLDVHLKIPGAPLVKLAEVDMWLDVER